MSAPKMSEIRLLSTLGKRYGRSHWVQLDTNTPAEAVRWLRSQFPDATRYLAGAHEKGIAFAVFRGRGKHRENIGKEQLCEPAGGCITIAPIMRGAKNGALQVILGIVLIVIGAFIGVASEGTAGVVAQGLVSLGIGMVVGGVVQLLTPQPKINKGSADSPDNQASYVFNGPTNTTAQGNCVPVVYGRVRAGSAVISAGISSEDYVPASAGVGPGSPGGGGKRSPYDVVDGDMTLEEGQPA